MSKEIEKIELEIGRMYASYEPLHNERINESLSPYELNKIAKYVVEREKELLEQRDKSVDKISSARDYMMQWETSEDLGELFQLLGYQTNGLKNP